MRKLAQSFIGAQSPLSCPGRLGKFATGSIELTSFVITYTAVCVPLSGLSGIRIAGFLRSVAWLSPVSGTKVSQLSYPGSAGGLYCIV